MKPLQSPQTAAMGGNAPAKPEREVAPEARQLWQELLQAPPKPATSVIEALSSAALSGAGSAQDRAREQNDGECDASGLLACAAHVLAESIQQLGFASFQHDQDEAQPESHASDNAALVQLHLRAVDAAGGVATLEIAHPELGPIVLEVQLQDGVVHVVASAPSEQAARVLEAGQALLAQRLRAQGVVLQALEVVVARRRTGRNSDPARSAKLRRQESRS
jgi:flagellar hook-length control protein FliK